MLCTPPALILSQDQTLEIMVSKRLGEESIKSISSLIAHLLFFRVCISLSELSRCSAQSTHISRCVLASYLSLTVQFSRTVLVVSLSRGDLIIIPHLFPFVNRFLKLFSKNFLTTGSELRYDTAFLRLETILPLSSPFVNPFFENF